MRASLDADAVISIHSAEVVRFLCLNLKMQGFSVKYQRGGPGDPIGEVININDSFNNRVDLINGIRGLKEEAFLRTREVEFMGSGIKMIGPEDLIAMKIFAGSIKDMHDAAGIIRISGQDLNINLLKSITNNYGKSTLRRLNSILLK